MDKQHGNLDNRVAQEVQTNIYNVYQIKHKYVQFKSTTMQTGNEKLSNSEFFFFKDLQ